MKKYLLYTALVYLIFVVYGSLVPLHFKSIPLEVAWQRFEDIRYLNLGIGSRADWVANILLFIPLAFLWTGVLWTNCSFIGKMFVSLFVGLFCTLLCVSIEFTQLFFPPRTVSLNDIIAECTGAVIGIAAWWFIGAKIVIWVDEWFSAQSSINNLDRYLQIYLAGLFFYNVMPLDLTISPIEIYHKWNEGRVILIPFGGLKEKLVVNLYEWSSEIALWIPVPLLWQRRGCLSCYQLWIRIFFAVVAIEFFQLFVYSRVTDVTDILLALAGGGLGIWIGGSFLAIGSNEKQGFKVPSHTFNKPLMLGVIGYILWCFILMLVFWYPFDFKLNHELVEDRLAGFFNIPFYSYYYGTEFRAVTEVFHKILFFMPLGGLLAFIARGKGYRHFSWGASLFVLTLSAFMIEVVQVLLPDKVISSTDLILEIMGGQVGFIIGRHFFSTDSFYRTYQNRVEHVGGSLRESWNNVEMEENLGNGELKTSAVPERLFFQKSWVILLFGMTFFTVGFLVIGQSSSIPYNIRELMGSDHALFRAFGLSLTVFWCFSFPAWFLLRTIKKELRSTLCIIYGVCIHSFFAWFLIRMTAPLESIHDIVGSPILALSAELEIFFRFFALFSIFSLASFGSVFWILVLVGSDKKLWVSGVLGFVVAAAMLPICYWIVVIDAATDNLTELMRNEGRSFSVIGFFIYMFLFGYVGSILSAIFALRRMRLFLWAAGLLLVSFPAGYALLNWATESVIFKYGSIFSAMQFLFSPDRTHFVTGNDLFTRFCFAHGALIALIIISQFPFWSNMANKYQLVYEKTI